MAGRRHLLDRYGADLEADLFERFGIDIVDFYRGRHSWSRFDNLVERLQRRTDSWVSGARATDVEAYRAARDAGLIDRRRKGRTDPIEWGTQEQLLAAIFLLQQQTIHAIYTAGTKAARKKPKLNPWPAPRTAEALVRAEDVRVTFHHLETEVIRPVSADEYAALVAAAADGPQVDDPGEAPPDAPGPKLVRSRPDEHITRGGLGVPDRPATTNRPVPEDVAHPFRT